VIVGASTWGLPSAVAGRLPRWLTADLGRTLDLTVVLLVAIYIGILMPGLTRWPPLINDEGREANLFWVASGADPLVERMNAYRGFTTWGNGGLQGATAAIIFRLGGVGVFQARLTSLLWGGLLLLVVYWLGRSYWNRAVGLAAATMLAISNPFLVATHTLRPDVQVVTMVLGALLLAERSVDPTVRRPLLMAFLAGLVLGLVVDTHPNGAAFFPLVGLVYPLRFGWRACIRRSETWIFAAGIVAAALYYLSVRFLPDPAGFMTALGYWVGVDKAPPAVRVDDGGAGARLVSMLMNEIARYLDYFDEEPLELAVILLGLAGGAWMAIRGSYPARLILLGLAFAFAFFVVAVSTKSKYYMLLTYPLYLLLLARVLERTATWAAERVERALKGFLEARLRPPRRASSKLDCVPPLPRTGRGAGGEGVPPAHATTSAAILSAFVLAVVVWPLKLDERAWENYILAGRYREGQEYVQLTDRLKELAGPDATILAPPLYWIGMHDHPFVDIYVFERVERQYGMTATQFLDEVRPDFVITDAKIATERRVERLLYDELDRRSRYEVIVRHKNFGDVAIYRLRP
jgi:hypothetical protein